MTGRERVWIGLTAAGVAALAAYGGRVYAQSIRKPAPAKANSEHALKVITMNTGAYSVNGMDKRSEKIVAAEDMHIVSVSHFIGVQSGVIPSDNGHMLSTSPDNPWVKWENAGTGMEPTGSTDYFAYAGRDYYGECSGIGDVCWQENMPAGCHVLIKKGATLHMHCYAAHGRGNAMFHHAVRIYYW